MFFITTQTLDRKEAIRRLNLIVGRDLRAMADEKARSGRDVPQLNWRYILFNWNDSDEEMQKARERAAAIGVDRLCWEITDHPEEEVYVCRRVDPAVRQPLHGEELPWLKR